MPSQQQIRVADISALDAGQLQELLNKLLYLEALHHGIPLSGVHGTDPARITVADGGRDAKIEWSSGPNRTNFFPGRANAFQSKAESMSKTKCCSEMLVAAPPLARRGSTTGKRSVKKQESSTEWHLKPEIAMVLDVPGGAYVIFCNKPAEGKMHSERVAGMRDALKAAGRPDCKRANVEFYDATKIVNWVNQYPTAICWVMEQHGRGDWSYVQTWENWVGNPEIATGPFVTDAAITEQLAGLRTLIRSARSVSRVVGLSGLGKTRLAFEALRPPPQGNLDSEQQALCESVLYVKAGKEQQSALLFAKMLRREQWPALLVVDDCDATLHQELKDIAGHRDSQFRLLTLDFDPTSHSNTDHVVKLAKVTDDVIRKILRHAHPNIPEHDLDRIVRFAQGYPRIAVELGQATLSQDGFGAELNDHVLLNK